MALNAPLVNVLFGSVTGNAEEIARRIHAELPQRSLRQGLVRCLADFADVPAFADPAAHPHVYNVIVVSTTGDGDPPETIRPFMRLLRSKDAARLAGLNFAVLGLGDTNYENFCKTGKRVDTTLPKLGASRFFKRGDADDGVGLELVVEPWITSLWAALKGLSPSDTPAPAEDSASDASPTDVSSISSALSGKENRPPKEASLSLAHVVGRVTAQELGFSASSLPPIPEPKFSIRARLETDKSPLEGTDDADTAPHEHPAFDRSVVRVAELSAARRLTAPHSDRTAWHAELQCAAGPSSLQGYRPGDAFGVFVENDADEVARFLCATRTVADAPVCLCNLESGAETWTTALRLVRYRVDLRATPSKTLLRALADHCDVEEQRKLLLHLSSRNGRSDYSARFVRAQNTILHVLEKIAPSCCAPLATFVNLAPTVAPRWYSATSSPQLDGGDVLHFAFSVVPGGLATNALARRCEALQSGESVTPVFLLPRESDNASHFRPPEGLGVSYIMIGPGTGVAPFRGFLRERQALLAARDDASAAAHAKTMLFFGCRRRDEDFLYRDDLEQLEESGTLSVLDVALSRETDSKVYVQDRLLERRGEVAEIVRSGGSVFVCGDGGGMALGVQKALTTIVTEECCDGDEGEGKAMMKKLAEEHRYVKDIWFHG